jgi:hypothetical protein
MRCDAIIKIFIKRKKKNKNKNKNKRFLIPNSPLLINDTTSSSGGRHDRTAT